MAELWRKWGDWVKKSSKLFATFPLNKQFRAVTAPCSRHFPGSHWSVTPRVSLQDICDLFKWQREAHGGGTAASASIPTTINSPNLILFCCHHSLKTIFCSRCLSCAAFFCRSWWGWLDQKGTKHHRKEGELQGKSCYPGESSPKVSESERQALPVFQES